MLTFIMAAAPASLGAASLGIVAAVALQHASLRIQRFIEDAYAAKFALFPEQDRI